MGGFALGGGALAAAVAVALGLSLWWGAGAAASRRVIASFVLRVALPMAILLGGPLVLLGQVITLDERLWQALIAGVVIATGWLATAIFAEVERAAHKAERTRDAHKALFAEIRDVCAAYWSEGEASVEATALRERMRADPGFVPFIPREAHGRIYGAMLDQIDVLPRQTIDAIVAFYSLVSSVEALAEDMRGDRYAGLEPERRIAIYHDWTRMRDRAFGFGQRALQLIEAYSKGGREAAERRARALSNPGGGRSVRGRPDRD